MKIVTSDSSQIKSLPNESEGSLKSDHFIRL